MKDNELEKIELLLNDFEKWQADKQANEYIKNKIKEFILFVHEDTTLTETEKQTATSKALKLLAENTGCSEDYEIAMAILNDLFYERKIINQNDMDYFHDNSPINRWL